MTHVLVATAFIVGATYLGTAQDQKTLSHKDEILRMRQEVRDEAQREAEEESKREFGGSAKNYFMDRRKTTREKYVRKLLENMFRYKFPSVKPAWLINHKTGRRMEIDCFCKELRVGVEIDGEQHHKYIPYFHKKGYSEFVAMKDRDMLKSALMKKQGVRLIRLPYTIQESEIEGYLLEQMNKVL